MANEKNLVQRKKFSTEKQPAKPGRRKSQLADFITQNEIPLRDLKKILQGILFNHSITELEALKKDKTIPAVISFIVSALLGDMDKGRLDVLVSLLNICYGKPIQVVEVKIHDVSVGT